MGALQMARKSIDIKYVKLLRQGNADAFEEIFRFYKDSIYYFSLSFVKNKADAEEVVQDTFIEALKHIHTLEKTSSFHSWLHKIAYNKSMTLCKRNSRNVQIEGDFDLENILEEEGDPANMVSRNELISTIQKEIESMPANLVRVAQLRYFDDFTTKEIAEILDIPEGTVKSRLKKVRRIIQPKLSSRGFSPAKYFVFTPIMFEAFQEILKYNQLSNEQTTKMLGSMAKVTGTLLAGLAAGVGGAAAGAGGVGSSFSTGLQTAGKVALATVSGGAGMYGVYQLTMPNSAQIVHVAYYDHVTNQNLEVEVLFSEVESKENVAILHEGKEVPFDLQKDTLLFDANSNGEYTIKVEEEVQTFRIANIDKTAPELVSVTRQGELISFVYIDDVAGVDYAKSYFLDKDGNQVALPEDGQVTGDYSGMIHVYLYDKAGNVGEYDVNIGE